MLSQHGLELRLNGAQRRQIARGEVVRIVAESDDPLAAVSQCLRVGARAMRAAHVTVDLDVIERSFSELEARFALMSGEFRRLFLVLEAPLKLSKADA